MKYLVRSLKYFLKLCVICMVVFFVMVAAKMTPISPVQAPGILFHTAQGWILIVAAAVLSALYPRFGFLTRQIAGDAEEHRMPIVDALKSMGYALASEQDGRMIFRAMNPIRRLTLLFEDAITVSQYGQWIVLDGPGKPVTGAELKLKSLLEQTRE